MSVEGTGHAYLADKEKKVQLLELAPDDSMDTLAGAFAGRFTNVSLEGPVYVATTTHADPIVLSQSVSTDPGATVAWSGTTPIVEVNTNLSATMGQESGERFQMNFSDDFGFVVVQSTEELSEGVDTAPDRCGGSFLPGQRDSSSSSNAGSGRRDVFSGTVSSMS